MNCRKTDTWTRRRNGIYAELALTTGEKYRIVVTVTVWSDSDPEAQALKSKRN